MHKLLIALVSALTISLGIGAATVEVAGATAPVDENGCTASETYSGPFSAQLGVTGCVPNGTSVTFCHATSSETNPFNTLTTAIAAAVGQAGHFYENGTTQAGHEEDYVGPCTETPPPEQVEVCDPESGDVISVDEEDADQYLPADDPACAPVEPARESGCVPDPDDPGEYYLADYPAGEAPEGSIQQGTHGLDQNCQADTPGTPDEPNSPDGPSDNPPIVTAGAVPHTS